MENARLTVAGTEISGDPVKHTPLFILDSTVSSVSIQRGPLLDGSNPESHRWFMFVVADKKEFQWEYNSRDKAMHDARSIADFLGQVLRESVRSH